MFKNKIILSVINGKNYETKILTRSSDNFILDNQEYEATHLFWNGLYYNTVQVKPEKIKTKSNHGIGRAVAGGIIAGATGAVVGAVTASKTSTVQKPLTTTLRAPQNAILELKNIQTGEIKQLTVSFMTENGFYKFEKKIGLQHENY
ncbi:MAG TPA: hypothetical protein K8V00_01950 [Ligilactobacillus acidipiscis]|uniref:Uncharacterized protein n=1 Tax=Ligilactobacillus acidipiscis TaxID=89059 RepID=A0A921F6N2_9LACO|nr:hypothetical protein [Ligilactobacillus acidipiscis]